MTFKDFLKENSSGTYIAVKFSSSTNEKLEKFTKDLGLTPVEDFHCTICYSKKKLNVNYGEKDFNGNAKITGINYLGEKDSDYRAFVLEIDSPEIKKLHEKYVQEYNYEHTFDKFIQHISLAYKPDENIDIKNIELPNFNIEINKEIIETLKEL